MNGCTTADGYVRSQCADIRRERDNLRHEVRRLQSELATLNARRCWKCRYCMHVPSGDSASMAERCTRECLPTFAMIVNGEWYYCAGYDERDELKVKGE